MTKCVMVFLFSLLFTLLTGCTSKDGEGRYRIATIGNAERSVEAVVISTKPALVKEDTTDTGALAGGLAGGAIALNGDNAAVIVAGIVGGMIVGGVIEDYSNIHEATKYEIKTSNDKLLTVVQVNKDNPRFLIGDKVILIYGYPSKLMSYSSTIPDPKAIESLKH